MKQRLYLILLCNFFFFCSVVAQNKMLNSPSRKLQLAEFAISNLYVDQVDENKLVESAIVKMLEQLDPHSTYSDPEEVKALNEPLQGNFDGIGIQFNMATDTLFVILIKSQHRDHSSLFFYKICFFYLFSRPFSPLFK